jgi:hypothetical protein
VLGHGKMFVIMGCDAYSAGLAVHGVPATERTELLQL